MCLRGERPLKYTTPIKMNYEFRRVYSKGKSAATPRMVLYVRKNGRGENRLGVTVGKKIGKAVVRNRVKRRFREIYRLNEKDIRTGCDLIMAARVMSARAEYSELNRDFLRLAGRLGIRKED